MRRVVLITGHYYESKRRAGFHWLADAYLKDGWQVIFMTVGLSWLSWLRRDHRLQYPVKREAGKIKWLSERLGSYVWFTNIHPVNFYFDWLNEILRPFLSGYDLNSLGEIEQHISEADMFIFESSYGLALFERFKMLNNKARFIYRVSDDLRLIRVHPLIREAEMKYAPRFDLISVPSNKLYERFSELQNALIHHHGIQKALFDRAISNPYNSNTYNLVFVGNSRLDVDFLQRASRLFPDWNFHVIGPLGRLPPARNIIAYGELPFTDTVPLLKFADIGLQTLAYVPGAECFTDSLKMIQYQYCGLPVIAPAYLRSERLGIYYYKIGDDDSIKAALLAAKAADRSEIEKPDVRSWDELISIFNSTFA